MDDEYDTEALIEDIPTLNEKDQDKLSNVFQSASDKNLYQHIQKYIYYQRCMGYLLCVYVFRRRVVKVTIYVNSK